MLDVRCFMLGAKNKSGWLGLAEEMGWKSERNGLKNEIYGLFCEKYGSKNEDNGSN